MELFFKKIRMIPNKEMDEIIRSSILNKRKNDFISSLVWHTVFADTITSPENLTFLVKNIRINDAFMLFHQLIVQHYAGLLISENLEAFIDLFDKISKSKYRFTIKYLKYILMYKLRINYYDIGNYEIFQPLFDLINKTIICINKSSYSSLSFEDYITLLEELTEVGFCIPLIYENEYKRMISDYFRKNESFKAKVKQGLKAALADASKMRIMNMYENYKEYSVDFDKILETENIIDENHFQKYYMQKSTMIKNFKPSFLALDIFSSYDQKIQNGDYDDIIVHEFCKTLVENTTKENLNRFFRIINIGTLLDAKSFHAQKKRIKAQVLEYIKINEHLKKAIIEKQGKKYKESIKNLFKDLSHYRKYIPVIN